VSGDSDQLQILLSESPDFDVNCTHHGKDILQAMFSANPKYDVPFKNEKANYPRTISILTQHGLSNVLIAKTHDHYKTAQNNLHFFQKRNPVPTELLMILGKTFSICENINRVKECV
jgi:hypothetical protein